MPPPAPGKEGGVPGGTQAIGGGVLDGGSRAQGAARGVLAGGGFGSVVLSWGGAGRGWCPPPPHTHQCSQLPSVPLHNAPSMPFQSPPPVLPVSRVPPPPSLPVPQYPPSYPIPPSAVFPVSFPAPSLVFPVSPVPPSITSYIPPPPQCPHLSSQWPKLPPSPPLPSLPVLPSQCSQYPPALPYLAPPGLGGSTGAGGSRGGPGGS